MQWLQNLVEYYKTRRYFKNCACGDWRREVLKFCNLILDHITRIKIIRHQIIRSSVKMPPNVTNGSEGTASVIATLVSGAVSGALADVGTHPISTVKTR